MARTYDYGARRALRPHATGWIKTVLTWMTVARQRRQLAAMNDHLLKDLGLTRADVEAEARRPFWDTGLHHLERGERS